MRNTILVILFSLLAIAFALDKPTNYYAAQSSSGGFNGGVRGNQQQVADFAVWNLASANWQNALPPRVTGTVRGIVAVGDGLLAFGDFTSIGGRKAAGLAWFNGQTWCAPESLGVYTYTTDFYKPGFDNVPTAVGNVFAATVQGNNVFLYGAFNQVGLLRDGVAGLVCITYLGNGAFSITRVGLGYQQSVTTNPPNVCASCPRDTQPGSGSKNKLMTYTSGTDQYFVFQSANPGNIHVYKVNDPAWVLVTQGNGARNLTGVIQDFDVFGTSIYVVGKFEVFADPNPANQYLHIAVSNDNGQSFGPVFNPQPLTPYNSFGDVPVLNDQFNNMLFPALTGSGLSAITVRSASNIFVAGGYRVNERNKTLNNLAGELQTRIIQITGAGAFTLFGERFSNGEGYTGASPNFNGPTINKLQFIGNDLYAFGGFSNYRQVVPPQTQLRRFPSRYTEAYKGAIVFRGASSTQASPAFGGFLAAGNGDNSPTFGGTAAFVVPGVGNNLVYFASTAGGIGSTYLSLSGGLFGYSGDKLNNQDNRWNPLFGNNRFVSAYQATTSASQVALPVGVNGEVYSLHVTNRKDALIFGGRFDWVGSERIAGIGFFNPDLGTVGAVGAGLFQFNNAPLFGSDDMYNNRIGGDVRDIDERGDYLYAAGEFNRNNTGFCLSNIARIAFREGGAGWEPVDGGCDSRINDILIVGDLLYVTGTFSFCGLNPEGYQESGLLRGRVPTSRIAVIDLSQDVSKQSWRPLGIGLVGGNGVAMTYNKGDLYVAGTFGSAGGVLNSDAIARWDGEKWRDVVGRCLGNCDRPNNIFPYIGTGESPDPTSRRPSSVSGLATIKGNVYAIDSNIGSLSWWDGSVWRQTGTLGVQNPNFQNSLISLNGSNTDFINVGVTSTGANANNYASWNRKHLNYEPSFGGFSIRANAFASASTLVISQFFLALILFVSVIFFF